MLSESISLRVYPNPTSRGSYIDVELPEVKTSEVKLEIVDIVGEVLLEKEVETYETRHRVHLPIEMQSGVYNLVVHYDGMTFHQKFTVE